MCILIIGVRGGNNNNPSSLSNIHYPQVMIHNFYQKLIVEHQNIWVMHELASGGPVRCCKFL